MRRVTLLTEINSAAAFDFSVRRVAAKVCRAALIEEKCPYPAEVSFTLTGNERIREINREFRDMDNVTDVLSFPNLEYDCPSDFEEAAKESSGCMDPETGRLVLGDIVLNADRVKEQAAEYGHSELREFAFLIAHSMLHLCGYDHETPEEAREMEERQEKILAGLGITREV